MSLIRETTKYLALKEDEPPRKKLITEGDILIKSLIKKQQETDVKIQDYLQHQKSFEKVSEHISLTSCHSGATSLEQFKTVINRIEDIEHLRSAGLENEDIKLLWDYRQNNMDVKYKNVEHSILENKITRILEMLQTYENLNNTARANVKNARSLNKETVLAAKPNSTVTKLLKFAIDNKQSSESSLFATSMDHLKDIEQDRFSYLDDEILDVKKVQKRIRNINNRINNIGINLSADPNKIDHKKHNSGTVYVENSNWDIKVKETTQTPQHKTSKIYGCKAQNYYTIKKGEIVKLNEEQIAEKGLEFKKTRLSVEEIKKVPRFANYSPGTPSNVLYLKNLARNITENDLEQIFIDFLDVTFKIMGGKMKGQAFATFSDINEASRALQEINGLLINEKPIVVEYGKKGIHNKAI